MPHSWPFPSKASFIRSCIKCRYCLLHTSHFLGAVMMNKTESLSHFLGAVMMHKTVSALCGNSHVLTFILTLVRLSFTCFPLRNPSSSIDSATISSHDPYPCFSRPNALHQRIPLSPKTLSTFLFGSHVVITELKDLKLKSFLLIFFLK